MVILMAGVIFTEPDVDVDADGDVDVDDEVMLSWEIRLLFGLLKKVNNERTKDKQRQTPEVRAISAAKTDAFLDHFAAFSADLAPCLWEFQLLLNIL